jgi:hypothetical protein
MIALITAILMFLGGNFSSDSMIVIGQDRAGDSVQVNSDYKAASNARSEDVELSDIIYGDMTGV